MKPGLLGEGVEKSSGEMCQGLDAAGIHRPERHCKSSSSWDFSVGVSGHP